MPFLRFTPLTLTLVTLLFVSARPAQSAENIVVDLVGGKRLVAKLSLRSNDHRLCIATTGTNTMLIRQIRWEDIVSARLEGKTYRQEALHLAVMKRMPRTPLPTRELLQHMEFPIATIRSSVARMARVALGMTDDR